MAIAWGVLSACDLLMSIVAGPAVGDQHLCHDAEGQEAGGGLLASDLLPATEALELRHLQNGSGTTGFNFFQFLC